MSKAIQYLIGAVVFAPVLIGNGIVSGLIQGVADVLDMFTWIREYKE